MFIRQNHVELTMDFHNANNICGFFLKIDTCRYDIMILT